MPLLALSVILSALAVRVAASEMLPDVDVSVMSPSPPALVPAVTGEVTVRAAPAVTATVPPVTPAPLMRRSFLSVKETALVSLFTDSESTSLPASVRFTVPALAVIASVVPEMGPVCVRLPPTASVIA